MVVKKTTTEKTSIQKETAPKTSVKKTVKKAAMKKAPAKKAVKKLSVPQERFYAMVSEAAYFAAQNDGNRKGSVEYWLEAETAVRARFNIA